MPQHCIECFAFTPEELALPDVERRRLIAARVKSVDSFAPGALASKAPLGRADEAAVLLAFLVLMGGPLLLLASGIACVIGGSWRELAMWCALSVSLALHPLPSCAATMRKSWFARSLYRYFSYRFVWSGDALEALQDAPAWFGAGPPHGVLPLANLLSIAAINTFCSRRFVGATASVVSRTPFLRYMTLFGCIDISAPSIRATAGAGTCVGLVPDGIAGIFKTRDADEVVYLEGRKGLAKLALRTGTPILPAYSIGNTAVFGAWFDPFGVMEAASRRAQAAFFVYWGRFGLPLPRRVNITMVFGTPILVQKVAEPTGEQVDALHAEYLRAIEALFDTHKAALGWGHKRIRFA